MRNRRHHTVPRWKTFQRAHLLGSSFRACAARASGFIEAPGSGSRDRKEGGGSYSAFQPDNGTRWGFARIVSAWRERSKPGPKGPTADLIRAVIELKRRN